MEKEKEKKDEIFEQIKSDVSVHDFLRLHHDKQPKLYITTTGATGGSESRPDWCGGKPSRCPACGADYCESGERFGSVYSAGPEDRNPVNERPDMRPGMASDAVELSIVVAWAVVVLAGFVFFGSWILGEVLK